jgi:hypothetical protein
MPKQLKVSTGPFSDLLFQGHEDADAFDVEAGEKGACVEEADASVAYRSTLPEFHKAFTPTMESMSSIKRGVNAEATARAKARSKTPEKVEDVPESFITYANRVKAQVGDEAWKPIDAAARELAASMKIDASPGKRQAGPGKDLLAKADSLLTLPADQLQTKVDKYLGAVEGFELQTDEATGKPDRASLARLVGKYLEYLLAQD